MSETYLSVRTAARRLGLSVRTIYRLVETGELDSTSFGARSTRISEDAFQRFIERRTAETRRTLGLDDPLIPAPTPRKLSQGRT